MTHTGEPKSFLCDFLKTLNKFGLSGKGTFGQVIFHSFISNNKDIQQSETKQKLNQTWLNFWIFTVNYLMRKVFHYHTHNSMNSFSLEVLHK